MPRSIKEFPKPKNKKEMMKLLYQKNKEYALKKIYCECGSMICRSAMAKHLRSMRHKKLLQYKLKNTEFIPNNDECKILIDRYFTFNKNTNQKKYYKKNKYGFFVLRYLPHTNTIYGETFGLVKNYVYYKMSDEFHKILMSDKLNLSSIDSNEKIINIQQDVKLSNLNKFLKEKYKETPEISFNIVYKNKIKDKFTWNDIIEIRIKNLNHSGVYI
jgi:hypothetical protein